VSEIEQMPAWEPGTLFTMDKYPKIVGVEKDGVDGLIVTFSDGTMGGYVVEELLEIRPIRERVEEPKARNPRQKPVIQ